VFLHGILCTNTGEFRMLNAHRLIRRRWPHAPAQSFFQACLMHPV